MSFVSQTTTNSRALERLLTNPANDSPDCSTELTTYANSPYLQYGQNEKQRHPVLPSNKIYNFVGHPKNGADHSVLVGNDVFQSSGADDAMKFFQNQSGRTECQDHGDDVQSEALIESRDARQNRIELLLRSDHHVADEIEYHYTRKYTVYVNVGRRHSAIIIS